MKELWLFPVLLAEESATEDVLPQGVTVHFSGISTFMVENIRSARRFLTSLKQGIVIDDCTFFLLDKNTTEEEVRKFLANQSGRIGVMSEAGCPGIADPGSLAVRWAHQMGWKVKPLVGPTSIALGLMASGMSGQSFVFHGYLPIEAKDRQGKIRSLVQAVQKLNQTQIFIETPYRNQALLAALLQEVPPNVRLCIGCNLTAANEWIWAGTVADWRKKVLPEGKWPAIFLLGQ